MTSCVIPKGKGDTELHSIFVVIKLAFCVPFSLSSRGLAEGSPLHMFDLPSTPAYDGKAFGKEGP